MNITKINVSLFEKNKIKALVSVKFDDEFYVNGLKIVEGEKGLFIAMPSVKGGDGEFQDICFPVTADMRNYMTSEILEAYEKKLEEKGKTEKGKEDKPKSRTRK